MKETLQQNPPNAAKLVFSLRHLDYDNLTALADLVDNAIDANASQIWVDIVSHTDNKPDRESEVARIIIADNGRGMDTDVLDEALRLGSDTERNASYDLGFYGMGLVTASISMGTRLEVITKASGGDCLKSVQDLAVIFDRNEFVKTLDKANEQEQQLFQEHLKRQEKNEKMRDSGTMVIIDQVDNCQWKHIKGLAERLSLHFGQVYRKFLNAGKIRIYVQNREVKAIDPINDFEPTILNEEEIKLPDGTIKITIAELKDYGTAINKDKGINIPNQGFYVFRNNREILAGNTLNVFPKHNDLNTLRIEFCYPGTLDTLLSSNFSKNRITLNQSIRTKVESICNPFIKQVRWRSKERQRNNREVKEDFTEVEKFITAKSHLLQLLQSETLETDAGQKDREKIKRNIEKNGSRLNIQKRPRVNLESLKARFETKRLGERGPLYEVDQERGKVIIKWNADHPFYVEFIERNADNPDVLNPICFLVYCLGSAELGSRPDSDTEEILMNIRYNVGLNLAVLLR